MYIYQSHISRNESLGETLTSLDCPKKNIILIVVSSQQSMNASLPNEILAQIFTLLPTRSSLIVAALVCNRWRDAAIPLLWTDIHIAIDASSPQFTDAIKFRNFLRINVANAEYIKMLSLNFNMPP